MKLPKDQLEKMIEICTSKIEAKIGVQISFYVFFKNKNDNPKMLLDVATWWIWHHKLDHFEKAEKIKKMLLSEL